MAKRSEGDLEATKRLMGALLRQPPKPHEDMRVGHPKTGKPEKDKSKSAKKVAKRPD